jgi:hypothetical protein
MQNLVFGKIKNFLRHHPQDVECIFTFSLGYLSVGTNVGDEFFPGCAPLELNDRD